MKLSACILPFSRIGRSNSTGCGEIHTLICKCPNSLDLKYRLSFPRPALIPSEQKGPAKAKEIKGVIIDFWSKRSEGFKGI